VVPFPRFPTWRLQAGSKLPCPLQAAVIEIIFPTPKNFVIFYLLFYQIAPLVPLLVYLDNCSTPCEIMGHCVSTFDEHDIFRSKELEDQCARLRADAELRKSFVTYIKTGVWMDKVLEQVPKSQRTVTHVERLAYERENVLFEYRTADGRLKVFENIGPRKEVKASWSAKQTLQFALSASGRQLSGSASGSGSASESASGAGSGTSTPTQNKAKKNEEELRLFSESYFNIENCACVAFSELLPVLLYALLPFYLHSNAHTRFLHSSSSDQDNDSVSKSLNPMDCSFNIDKVPTKVSERAVNIFHGCAAYFDEASILEELETATWLHNVQKLLLNHALGITVVDVSDASLPIVFCNHRYASMVGASDRGSVEGKSMRVFYSSDAAMNATNVNVTNATATATATQVGELEAALRSGKVEKFAIAQQTQGGGQAFLDLVTVLNGWSPMPVSYTNKNAVVPRNNKFAALVHVLGNFETKVDDLKVI
jgi:hypothetical protein